MLKYWKVAKVLEKVLRRDWDSFKKKVSKNVKEVLFKCHRNLKGRMKVSRLYWGSVKEASKECWEYVNKLARKCWERFKKLSGSKDMLRKCQRSVKEVSTKCQGSVKEVSRKCHVAVEKVLEENCEMERSYNIFCKTWLSEWVSERVSGF